MGVGWGKGVYSNASVGGASTQLTWYFGSVPYAKPCNSSSHGFRALQCPLATLESQMVNSSL